MVPTVGQTWTPQYGAMRQHLEVPLSYEIAGARYRRNPDTQLRHFPRGFWIGDGSAPAVPSLAGSVVQSAGPLPPVDWVAEVAVVANRWPGRAGNLQGFHVLLQPSETKGKFHHVHSRLFPFVIRHTYHRFSWSITCKYGDKVCSNRTLNLNSITEHAVQHIVQHNFHNSQYKAHHVILHPSGS
jgi:hypothetical protein